MRASSQFKLLLLSLTQAFIQTYKLLQTRTALVELPYAIKYAVQQLAQMLTPIGSVLHQSRRSSLLSGYLKKTREDTLLHTRGREKWPIEYYG